MRHPTTRAIFMKSPSFSSPHYPLVRYPQSDRLNPATRSSLIQKIRPTYNACWAKKKILSLFADEKLVQTRSGSDESVVRQLRFGSSLNYLAAWKFTPTVSYPAAVITLPTPWVGARVSDAVFRRGEVGGSTWPGSYPGLSVSRYGPGTYPSLSVSRYG